jgi:predicted esterase
MKYGSFTDLHPAVGVLREQGDGAAALALVTEHLDAFSRHTALMYLIEAELLAESGRPTDALGVLDRALTEGCRYPREWFETNRRLASVVSLAGYAEFAARSQRQWDEAAAESKPELTLLLPGHAEPPSGHPLLVVLHGNNSTMTETVPFWSSAVDYGWVTAVPQSGEPGATPGSFTWNDRAGTSREIAMHLEAIQRDVHVNSAAVVLAGFSMGALQAIALVITGRIPAWGVLSIAAWLPHIRDFTALADAGTATIRPTYAIVGSDDASAPGAKQLVALMSRHGGRSHLEVRAGLGHEYPLDMPSTVARALAFLREGPHASPKGTSGNLT